MSLVNKLIENIRKNNEMTHTVAAVLLKKSRPVGKICCNTRRNYCRGKLCASIHAEANAMLTHFGKHLTYSPKHGWRQCLRERKEIRYNGN